MKEGLIIPDKVILGEVISGKKGAQENGVILDEKEFGIGIASVPGNPIYDPPKDPLPPPRGGGVAAMEFEKDIIL